MATPYPLVEKYGIEICTSQSLSVSYSIAICRDELKIIKFSRKCGGPVPTGPLCSFAEHNILQIINTIRKAGNLGRHQTSLSLVAKYGYISFAIAFGILYRARFDGYSTALQFVTLNL